MQVTVRPSPVHAAQDANTVPLIGSITLTRIDAPAAGDDAAPMANNPAPEKTKLHEPEVVHVPSHHEVTTALAGEGTVKDAARSIAATRRAKAFMVASLLKRIGRSDNQEFAASLRSPVGLL